MAKKLQIKISLQSLSPTTGANGNRLQDAINDSAKDHIRIDESLNYIKQRLFEQGEIPNAKAVERFQNPVDSPYQEIYGAAALFTNESFQATDIQIADSRKIPKAKTFINHPNSEQLNLIVIKGIDMMALVHELYRRAADEA